MADVAIEVLPYGLIVGQRSIKRALELAYIEPKISGVLLSGERGTGKSTAVRAFAAMMFKSLPVTLPINATEDRVVGGWNIAKLVEGKPEEQKGLLEEADGKLLYVDEVNLLDDHIVNILLDVTSTGVLVIQREGLERQRRVGFTLIGTMNPEEGGLRAQLTDRFGLMVDVRKEKDEATRTEILVRVLGLGVEEIAGARSADAKTKVELTKARERAPSLTFADGVQEKCVRLADAFRVDGHRGDYNVALAARALAACEPESAKVQAKHVRDVAQMALQHRRKGSGNREPPPWSAADNDLVDEVLGGTQKPAA